MFNLQRYMTNYKRIEQALKWDWYIQGFNAVPIFLNHAAYSGFPMKKLMGFGYTAFIFHYQKNYGEMWYLNSDFKSIWLEVKKRLAKDKNYLQRKKKVYEKIYNHQEKSFQKIIGSLSKLSDRELLMTFQKYAQAQVNSVGVAHILDPIGVELEKEFKVGLLPAFAKASVSKERFNEYYAILTTPTQQSFLAQEEDDLKKIGKLSAPKRKLALEEHTKKYFWIQNSYAAPKNLTAEDFAEHLKILQLEPKTTGFVTNKQKQTLIKKLKLSSDLRAKIGWIDFATTWQDERKANTLKIVGYFSLVIEEVAKRAKIDKNLIYYLGVADIPKIKKLTDLESWQPGLIKRSKGVFFLQYKGIEYAVSGREYDRLLTIRQKLESNNEEVKSELHGSVANGGTVTGRVAVCKNLSAIYKVQKGDILVASMTRPEFMPALKKAAAIITDEGGITCHAAIVARELNIPAIIGTKMATKILKDGMMVEVRANHGIVRILS